MLEPSPAAAAAAARAYHRPPGARQAAPGASEGAEPRGRGRAAASPAVDGALMFDGAHILEVYGLMQGASAAKLEAWLESLQLQPLGPVVRRASPSWGLVAAV